MLDFERAAIKSFKFNKFDRKKIETVGDLTDSDTADSDKSDETYDLSDDSIIENEYENVVVEQISLMEINNEQTSQVTDILQQDILFDYSSNSVFTYFNL